MSQTEFWTAEELAARLRVTKATIYRMARRGELPYYSIGRAMRFRSVDVEAFWKNAARSSGSNRVIHQ